MMFCKYCGSELPMGSSFCSNCTKEVEEGYLKHVMNKNDIANYVGKNEAYFSREFSNVVAGQKERFNWAAFWLGPFYCVYRKQYDILWKHFKVPLGAFLISFIGATIQILDGTMDIDALLKWMLVWLGLSFVATLWLYVAQVRLGRNFNRLYFESWKKKIAEKKRLKEYGGTSFKNVVILCLLSSIILSLPVVAIVKTQVFPALYSSNSYDIVEEKADDNEVVYGYNTYNPGMDIDEYANAKIKGHYITDLGTGFSLDENLCLSIYEDGHWKGKFSMSVIEFENDSLVIAGYIEEENWEKMNISSEEEAYYELEFVLQNGQVIRIFNSDKEMHFRKVSQDDFAEEMWRALDAEYRGKLNN